MTDPIITLQNFIDRINGLLNSILFYGQVFNIDEARAFITMDISPHPYLVGSDMVNVLNENWEGICNAS